jgi:diguanylate cyclase (GGDEF)-like protein
MSKTSKAPVEEIEYYKEKAIRQDILIFEMRALLQSGKGLGNILQMKPLLETFMAVVREKYGSINSTVLLLDDLDPSKEYYQIKAYHGLNDNYRDTQKDRNELLYLYKFPKDNGLLWQIIQQGNVFSVRDMQRDPRFDTAWRHWNLEVLKSDIWCPLIRNGNVQGILTLGECEDGSQIPETDYSFLQELASIATTNIDSTLKYEKNERILRNIQTLYDINQQIASVNDFKKLCIDSLSTAVDAVKAQKGNLMLLNKETGKLELKVVWGDAIPTNIRDDINNGITETKPIALGEGIAGQSAASRKAIRENDRDKIPQFGQHVVYCICSVPVIYGGVVEGVINMTNKVKVDENGNKVLDPLGRFTQEDLTLLVSLSDQAAVNLNKTRLYNASITDRMTGLYNTRHFEMVLHDELEKSIKSGKPMCLAVSDIDKFKSFNDTYGHKAGDEVLISVAKVLSSCRRLDKEDIVFRYGGEEYCMILPNTTPEEAATVIENYRRKVEQNVVKYQDKELKVTVSVGISATILDTSDIKEIFTMADEALYACKEGGRNQVRNYYQGLKRRFDPNLKGEELKLTLQKELTQKKLSGGNPESNDDGHSKAA